MTFFNDPIRPGSSQDVLVRVKFQFMGGLRTIGAGVSRSMTQLKLGRMKSVLHAMSDAQLGQIGITRSQIDRHAAFLVSK